MILCFGTRPEWLKIKPLLNHSKKFKIYFTGQHKDLIDMELPNIEIIKSKIKNKTPNRLNDIISSILDDFSKIENEKSILIQGDTASAFACALAGFNTSKKIIYLESGLRTFDLENPYPEEGYRQMISRIADINLCPTKLSKENLEKENINGKIYVVGNTVLDNINSLKNKVNYQDKILITLHRRENLEIMKNWVQAINNIAKNNKDLDFIYIKHPNQDYQKYESISSNIIFYDSLKHNVFKKILSECKFIITDSGGLQEEGAFLQKKVVVCRKTTERPEGINSGHIILCKHPKKLNVIFKMINKDYIINEDCPYGDGKSSERIVKILTKQNAL